MAREDQAAGILMQAALGLSYAHDQGMVHRDVKPGNILVTPDSIAKVSDVGLAGFTADLSEDPRAGKIVGTPDYLSPEQIRTPLSVNSVSDIYSLGCTLYYAVTGKAPFPGGDTASKIRRHLEATPLHPRNFNSELSEEFVEIIAEMMEKDPNKRIQTCAEVAARLEMWVANSVSLAPSLVSRGPWLAPPPPVVEILPSISSTADPLAATSIDSLDPGTVRNPGPGSLDGKAPNTAGGSEDQVPPPPYPESPVAEGNRTSQGMLIALTISIVLPPALLLGAILGYLIGMGMN